MNQSILHLVPDLIGSPGGIARYNRLICRVLLESDAAVKVIALADEKGICSESWIANSALSYIACQGSRREFIQQAVLAVLRQQPAIIINGHPYFSVLGWFLSRITGAVWASFIYGIDVWEPLSPLRRWALNRSDRIISISQFTANRGIEINKFSANRIRILNNCIDPQLVQPVTSGKGRAALSMLTVARMSKAEQYKGQDYVIQAMPALLLRFPQLRYHIVGDGDDRARLEILAEEQNVTHAVYFHGIVADEELQRLYSEASIFIMPSRAEGFGFVFIEAMAQGLPVIGGNVDATPEVIIDGQTGLLVDPTSVAAIVTAAERLLTDENLRQQMGEAGMAHVRQQYSYAHFRHRLLTYLSELSTSPMGQKWT